MEKFNNLFFVVLTATVMLLASSCQSNQEKPCTENCPSVTEMFLNPPSEAQPWVFWYWMRAAVSKEGITADLEAMHEAGIAGAYLMPIKGADETPLTENPVVQLSPEWWEMLRHAFSEADRLGLKLAMHVCDGFALAGGPWITPDLSMQKVVWSDTIVDGGRNLKIKLPKPAYNENYYQDIALYAYPTPEGSEYSTRTIKPKITTSTKEDASFLTDEVSKKKFRSSEPCWIQYTFKKPFLCRTVVIDAPNNYQSLRLSIETSDDGLTFVPWCSLVPPRHGWQDTDAPYSFAIKPVTSKYFRFVFDPEGSEPGAEDLDGAKWKATFKVARIEMSGIPTIGGIEGKNGSVWRISQQTSNEFIPDSSCIDRTNLLNLSLKMDSSGVLSWNVPQGRWTIIRMGHTSTSHTNYTGGGGLGLEVDKFNVKAVRYQYEQWFGKTIDMIGKEEASRVLKIFHVDSWECGSQNWSPVFASEFKRRRGYDPVIMLPVMAGVPIESAASSESFLRDVRLTISELITDNFYKTLAHEAKRSGCQFSAECTAPTMTGDGMLHYSETDLPMGEFWFRSPTHDKPNDALDAVSGAHIYGKKIVQAEGFTELRMAWDEHPAMVKTLGDRNFAQGFNRLVFHVFAHNPWTDRKPGMTLDPIGLFFQRDQTWWKPGRAWVDYVSRCQAVLQQGVPVADIAVFVGEEIPSRSVLPDRLVPVLPGIFGPECVAAEEKRLANEGLPRREMPRSVFGSANSTDLSQWIDPLNGYAYDSFNPDALIRLANVDNGRVVFPGGASYKLLVIPGCTKMSPNGNEMSGVVAKKLHKLINDGATVLFVEKPVAMVGDRMAERIIEQMFSDKENRKGKILTGAYVDETFDPIGLSPDFIANDMSRNRVRNIAWCHRTKSDEDVYFLSNQTEHRQTIEASFRISGKLPILLDPVTGEVCEVDSWHISDDRTVMRLRLEANASIFVVFGEETGSKSVERGQNWVETQTLKTIDGSWSVSFDQAFGGPENTISMERLQSWTRFADPAIKYYSGTATYSNTFKWSDVVDRRVWLRLGRVCNLAEVTINGKPCGVAWTYPYKVEITDALRQGENTLEIAVSNTWANRLIGDNALPESKRITWTTAPYMLEGKPLLDAGIMGRVEIIGEK